EGVAGGSGTRSGQAERQKKAVCAFMLCPLHCFDRQSDHDYLLILLLKSSTRRSTIQIEVTHQFIIHHNEYQLAPTEGVRADSAPSELLPRRGAAVHHAIGNERAGARARGPARIPA